MQIDAILGSDELRAEFMQNMKAGGHSMTMKNEKKMMNGDCVRKMQDDQQTMKGDGAMMKKSGCEKMMSKDECMGKMNKQKSSGQQEQDDSKQ